MVLKVDTVILEECDASIFRVEVCVLRNWLRYVGRWKEGVVTETQGEG
jgi:hypothetical protein